MGLLELKGNSYRRIMEIGTALSGGNVLRLELEYGVIRGQLGCTSFFFFFTLLEVVYINS